MSIERVASLAGVPKPTLYRRWSSKADLATAAIRRLQAQEPVPSTGKLEGAARGGPDELPKQSPSANGMSMIGTLLSKRRGIPIFSTSSGSASSPLGGRCLLRFWSARWNGGARSPRRCGCRGQHAHRIVLCALPLGGAYPKSWPRRIVETLWAGIRRD